MSFKKKFVIVFISTALSLELGLVFIIQFFFQYDLSKNSLAAFLLFLCLPALFLGGFIIGYVGIKDINPSISDLMGMIQDLGVENADKGAVIGSKNDFTKLRESFAGMVEEFKASRKQIEETNKSLKHLHNMSKTLSSTLDTDKLLDKFSDILLQSMRNTNCRVALYDDDRNNLIIKMDKAVPGFSPYTQQGLKFPVRLFDHNGNLVVDKGVKVLRVEDPGINLNSYEREFFFPNNLKSILLMPMNAKGMPHGYVMLGERRHWDRCPFTDEKIEFCTTLVNQTMSAIENSKLNKEVHSIYLTSITSLAETLDARDPYTMNHSKWVTRYALLLAKALGVEEKDLKIINNAGLLHDIGKIAIPDKVLHKPGKLTITEVKLIQEHPLRGAKILEPVKEFKELIPIVAHHHERYDGNGYSAHLKGENIPFGARIMAIADSFHAMISDRPYREGMLMDKAVDELIRCRGTQFDPIMVDRFVECIPQSLSLSVKNIAPITTEFPEINTQIMSMGVSP